MPVARWASYVAPPTPPLGTPRPSLADGIPGSRPGPPEPGQTDMQGPDGDGELTPAPTTLGVTGRPAAKSVAGRPVLGMLDP